MTRQDAAASRAAPKTGRTAGETQHGARKASGRKKADKNPTGRPTLAELERRKSKVMQVATSLFIRQGYAGTSLVDVAKGAGVATRTLYQHFGDKEALFRNIMFARDSAAVFEPPTVDANDTVFGAMEKTAQYVYSVSFRPNTVDLMRLAIAESKRFPELTKKVIDASYTRFRSNIKSIFDQLVERGLVKDDDTATSAEMFIHLLLGDAPLLVFAGWKPPTSGDEHLTEKIELFIVGRWGLPVPGRASTSNGKRRRG